MKPSLKHLLLTAILAFVLFSSPSHVLANDGERVESLSYSALIRKSTTGAKKGSEEVEAALEIITAGRGTASAVEIAAHIKANLPEIAPLATVRVPEEVLNNLIRDGDEYRELRAALRLLIEFFGLEGRILPVLFKSEMPVIGSSPPNGLMISTRAVALLSREELQAIAAHELCHLIVVDVFRAAVDNRDFRTLRIIELFCDARAAAIMKAIGHDPRNVINGLLKMQLVLETEFDEHDAKGKHPTIATRIRLSRELCRIFSPGPKISLGKSNGMPVQSYLIHSSNFRSLISVGSLSTATPSIASDFS